MTRPYESTPQPTDPKEAPPVDAAGNPDRTPFLGEFRRHPLVTGLTAYIAFIATTMGVSDSLRGLFEWSLLVPRLILAALLLGVPIVATVAWYQGHRRLRRVSRTEIAVLAVFVLIGSSVFWWVTRFAAITSVDRLELSLGFVSVRAERPAAASDTIIHGFASLYLYGNDTVHSAVRLRIAGLGPSPASVLDLSPEIPAGVGSGGLLIEFTAKAVAPVIAICLTMPHPRLHTLYRVTETYRVSPENGGDGSVQYLFNRIAQDRVMRDAGEPCVVPKR